MHRLNKLFLPVRFHFAIALIMGIAMVGGGVLLQQLMRLAACPLCILQRMLALLLLLLAALGLWLADRRPVRIATSWMMTACTLCGMFVAGYQTYLQRVAQEISCSEQAAWWELLVDWAGEHLPMLFHASGLCSDPAWKFIGLSIAEWSLLVFSGLTLLLLRSLLRRS